MKKQLERLKGKRLVTGDANLMTKNEICINTTSGGGVEVKEIGIDGKIKDLTKDKKQVILDFIYFKDVLLLDAYLHDVIYYCFNEYPGLYTYNKTVYYEQYEYKSLPLYSFFDNFSAGNKKEAVNLFIGVPRYLSDAQGNRVNTFEVLSTKIKEVMGKDIIKELLVDEEYIINNTLPKYHYYIVNSSFAKNLKAFSRAESLPLSSLLNPDFLFCDLSLSGKPYFIPCSMNDDRIKDKDLGNFRIIGLVYKGTYMDNGVYCETIFDVMNLFIQLEESLGNDTTMFKQLYSIFEENVIEVSEQEYLKHTKENGFGV